MTDWFARPVLHVTDVEASLRFYVDRLGFTSPWRYEEDGRARVAQAERQGCALILADQWPEKVGKGLMFISVNVEQETREAEIAALDALRAELEAKGVAVKEGSWGYRSWWSMIPMAISFSSPIRTRLHPARLLELQRNDTMTGRTIFFVLDASNRLDQIGIPPPASRPPVAVSRSM